MYLCAKFSERAELWTSNLPILSLSAEHYKMTAKQAYLYLKQYAGISFLDDCYEAEHQQSVTTAIEDLTIVCQNHGGGLRYA